MRLWPWRRSPRILALLVFRNEMRYLPDWFENVSPHVDGVVCLDDGSTDGSADFAAAQPNVLECIRIAPQHPHVWDDALNHRRVVEASWKFSPDWLVAIDADERIEKNFRTRAEREIARARWKGIRAYRVHVREIWDDPQQYRADGIWGAKSAPRLFEARRDHEFHMQRLHCYWAPLNSMKNGDFPQADLMLYHLRMLHGEDRDARRARYEKLDADRSQQAIGYAYMTDTTGLVLKRIEPEREYRPLPAAPATVPAGAHPAPFIIGAPRSGTTLLRLMLDAHPLLSIPPETAFLRLAPDLKRRRVSRETFLRAIVNFPESAPAWNDFAIPEAAFRESLAAIEPFDVTEGFRAFYRLYAARFGKPRWGDKTPLYCRAIEAIRATLPEARFIHIIRDGRDAALSLGRTWFSPGKDIESQAAYWRDCVTAAREAGLGRPDYLEVRYESLVRDPEKVLRTICEFISLPYDASMLAYHAHASSRLAEHGTRLRPDGSTLVTHEERLSQVRKTMDPPDADRIFAWRREMSAEDQQRFLAVAGELLRELGYEA